MGGEGCGLWEEFGDIFLNFGTRDRSSLREVPTLEWVGDSEILPTDKAAAENLVIASSFTEFLFDRSWFELPLRFCIMRMWVENNTNFLLYKDVHSACGRVLVFQSFNKFIKLSVPDNPSNSHAYQPDSQTVRYPKSTP